MKEKILSILMCKNRKFGNLRKLENFRNFIFLYLALKKVCLSIFDLMSAEI